MNSQTKKVFILDTNVLLYDIDSLESFEDNIVVLPITVLEELDGLKKGSDVRNFHAREFIRKLNIFLESTSSASKVGVALKNEGILFIETGKALSSIISESFPEKTADHRILAIAEYIQKTVKTTTKYKNINVLDSKNVILVTKDINLRAKARALDIEAEDYETGKIENTKYVDRGTVTIEVDRDIIDKLYGLNASTGTEDGLSMDLLTPFITDENPILLNDYFILRCESSSVLVCYNGKNKLIQRIEKNKVYGITPRNAEQTFLSHALGNPTVQLVAASGKAGTGKTLLALANALEQSKEFDVIMLARPIVPLSNKDMGFLPGDVQDKIGPYMMPLFDNLNVIKSANKKSHSKLKFIDNLQEKEQLIITPLAFIRGRSLNNTFFIVDEAQNLTPHEIKTIITRAGQNTKIIFTGDIYQIDSPYLDKRSNGLTYLIDKMKGQELIAHINIKKGETSEHAEVATKLL
jgi:PhoH-like ATPase